MNLNDSREHGRRAVNDTTTRQRPSNPLWKQDVVTPTMVITTLGLMGSELLPAVWRSSSARLWWRCQQAGVVPPADDLALFALFRKPFVE